MTLGECKIGTVVQVIKQDTHHPYKIVECLDKRIIGHVTGITFSFFEILPIVTFVSGEVRIVQCANLTPVE